MLAVDRIDDGGRSLRLPPGLPPGLLGLLLGALLCPGLLLRPSALGVASRVVGGLANRQQTGLLLLVRVRVRVRARARVGVRVPMLRQHHHNLQPTKSTFHASGGVVVDRRAG